MDLVFLPVVERDSGSLSLLLSLPLSRLTQSTIGSETATEWIELGFVRARVVARVPPMREPRSEIWGLARLAKVRRIWLNATAVSCIGSGKMWVGGERR